MKTTVIHHSADYDGIFCREIARKFCPPDTEFIGWDYGDAKLEFPKEGQVYVLDLSPDCFWESPLRAEFIGRLIWIDHHKSAIEKYDGTGWVHEPEGKDSFGVFYKEFWRKGHETRTTAPSPAIAGYRIDGVAACRLAWQWFQMHAHWDVREMHPPYDLPSKENYVDRDVLEPLSVRLAGEYDIWDKRDPRAETFQFGLRSCELPENLWELLLVLPDEQDGKKDVGTVSVEALLEAGALLQRYQREQDASVVKRGFEVEFDGKKFLALNTARCNSLTFEAAAQPHHDGLMGFYWDGAQFRVSLYHSPHHKEHDLSEIAVKFGGGGHRGACGFRATKLPFLP